MNNIKFNNEEKVQHFVNNLAQLNVFNTYKDLYKKVEKVKNKPNFKKFCIKKFDEWEIKVRTLYLYFNNK